MFSVLSSATRQERPDYASVCLKWWTANVKTHYGTPANQEPGLCGGTAEDDLHGTMGQKEKPNVVFLRIRRVCVRVWHCAVASVYRFLCDSSKLKSIGLTQCRSVTVWRVGAASAWCHILCASKRVFWAYVSHFFFFFFPESHLPDAAAKHFDFFNELLWFLSWFHFLRFYLSVLIATHVETAFHLWECWRWAVWNAPLDLDLVGLKGQFAPESDRRAWEMTDWCSVFSMMEPDGTSRWWGKKRRTVPLIAF